MSNFRIILVVLLGVSLIQALPAPKPTSKPTSARTKLSSRSAGLRTKTLATEEKKIGEGKATEMAIEAAEEPSNGGRKKKSTATTFCVEIRPTPDQPPTNICDPPPPTPAPIPTPICPEHDHLEQHDYQEHHEHHEAHPSQPLPPSQPVNYDPPMFFEKQPFISFQPQQQQTVACLEPQQPSIAYVSPPVAPCPCPCSPLHLITRFHSHTGGSLIKSNDMDGTSAFPQSSTADSQAPPYVDIQQAPAFPTDTSDSLYAKALEQNTQQSSMTGYQTPTADQAYHQQYTPGPYSSAMTTSGGVPAGGSFRIEGPSFSGAVSAPHMNIELPQGRPRYHHPSFPMQPMLTSMPHSGYMAYPSSAYPSHMGWQNMYRSYDPYPTFPMNTGGSPCNHQIRQQRQQQSDETKSTNSEEKIINQSDLMMSPREMLNKMRGNEPRRTISTDEQGSRNNENQSSDGQQINVSIPTSGLLVSPIDPSLENKTNEEKSFASKSSDFGKREIEPSVNVVKT